MRMRIPFILLLLLACGAFASARADKPLPLPTGRFMTPQGTQTNVGLFPESMALTPDGRFAVVAAIGGREILSVLDVKDGRLVSQVQLAAKRKGEGGKASLAQNKGKKGGKAGKGGKGKAAKAVKNGKANGAAKPAPYVQGDGKPGGLFYGLVFGARQADGAYPLYVALGQAEAVGIYTVSAKGELADTGRRIDCPSGIKGAPHVLAGLALDRQGRRLYAVDNNSAYKTGLKGALLVLDVQDGKLLRSVALPGYPFDVAALTTGAQADKKVYVSGERDGLVSVIDPASGQVVKEIKTGSHPAALRLDGAQRRLFVVNGDSDTVSIIDTATDAVTDTILLRPEDARGLPGVTPTGLTLAPGEKQLYVTLGGMNAVAVIDLPAGGAPATLAGYLPVGWYPTSLVAAPDGKRLMVANAKGVIFPNPNNVKRGPNGAWGQYTLDILEGTVSTFELPDDKGDLDKETHMVMANNRISPALADSKPKMANPGIKHVIYIIKENRTYDQVFGDLKQGNGDPSQCLFPREVTPNQHALAERFVLLDNFYVCAEVSAQGWGWSTAGMLSEFSERNTIYQYAGRGRGYDYEGQNNAIPVDLLGVKDVATPPSGYIWDAVLRRGLTLRNYGFFVNIDLTDDKTTDGRKVVEDNKPLRRNLVDKTDANFRKFDFSHTDSDAWVKHNCPFPGQKKEYGEFHSPSRIAEWKREFAGYVKNGNLPAFEMLRLGRNHTQGTSVGANSPRSMVADNDYAVGELVEAVSQSPYWRDTVICILEDDAQNGHDHVDAHRSPALVISPYVAQGTVDHRFFNTDSMLRTMEDLMGLAPMSQFDAAAEPIAVFGKEPKNDAPYAAILPAREIIAEINGQNAYKAKVSAALDFSKEDAIPDAVLNDILWHAVKGAAAAEPPIRHGLRVASAEAKAKGGDDDDD